MSMRKSWVIAFSAISVLCSIASASELCAYHGIQVTSGTTSTCPVGTLGQITYTVSASGPYACPVKTPNGYVVYDDYTASGTAGDATGFCNGIGGQWPPNVQTESCAVSSDTFCIDAYYQSMGPCPWAPLLPWPSGKTIFGTWACYPKCMSGC